MAERAGLKNIAEVAAHVSFGGPGPGTEAFAGKVGADPRDPPVPEQLFQMGSTSRFFAVAVTLKLETAGALSLDDAVGKWLEKRRGRRFMTCAAFAPGRDAAVFVAVNRGQ